MIQQGVLLRDLTTTSNSKSSGVVVIGDVHGCANALNQLTQKIQELPYSPTVVFVGDLLDRGEQGPEVWDLVRRMCQSPASYNAKEVVVLKGNHEQLLLDAYESENVYSQEFKLWEMNGGRVGDMKYVINYSPNEIEWIDSLSPYYIHDSKVWFNGTVKNLLITHGCVGPKKYFRRVDKQDPEYLFWERKFAGYGEEWLTVHGHTIQKKGLSLRKTPTGDVLLIDTGSFLTGIVTGVEFVDSVD